MATKQEIIKSKLAKYLTADKRGKSRILDALEEATGFARESIVRRLKELQLRPKVWKLEGCARRRAGRVRE